MSARSSAGQTFAMVQSGVASAERVFELLDADEEPADPAYDAAKAAPTRGEVAFEHVSFSYDHDRPLITDLSLVETHDCFTTAEMIEYEAMGLAAPGEGWKVVREGTARMDGALPVNPSGGLKSRGHPIGATGVSQHVMAAMQLVGEAGAMQVPGATLAGVFNMGGAAVANYCSILERVR